MRSSTRRSEKEIRRSRRQAAADRRIGHDMAYWYEIGPFAVRVAGLALLAGAAAWVWFNVDHTVIAFLAAAVGIALTLAYAASTYAAASPQRRMLSRATGQRSRPLWWHGVGAAGVLLLALAYVTMPF